MGGYGSTARIEGAEAVVCSAEYMGAAILSSKSRQQWRRSSRDRNKYSRCMGQLGTIIDSMLGRAFPDQGKCQQRVAGAGMGCGKRRHWLGTPQRTPSRGDANTTAMETLWMARLWPSKTQTVQCIVRL